MSEPLPGPAAVFEQMWLSSEKECEQLRAIRDGCERILQERAAKIERLTRMLLRTENFVPAHIRQEIRRALEGK